METRKRFESEAKLPPPRKETRQHRRNKYLVTVTLPEARTGPETWGWGWGFGFGFGIGWGPGSSLALY
ncbi:hypothetical protein TIFTF001_030335 [Ficus carica]|uniref:Uncharacterized protein n=1 Tax=Ficus carica TaxID=3494 RepID=A0AA88DT19_FICCA|nr:hypothetical protein TIFTF001_030335 [Ficus carica]